jgi:hypothetical protein
MNDLDGTVAVVTGVPELHVLPGDGQPTTF